MSVILSDDGRYRYYLSRDVADSGIVFAYLGVNCSYADAKVNDPTVNRWIGFTLANGGRKFVVGNPFAARSTNVRALANMADPIGPDNDLWLNVILCEADIVVPCWGNRNKVPTRWQYRFDDVMRLVRAFRKPVKTFGFNASGDPKHPLYLPNDTQLTTWSVTTE